MDNFLSLLIFLTPIVLVVIKFMFIFGIIMVHRLRLHKEQDLGHTKDNLMIICFISALLNKNYSEYVQCFSKKGKLISFKDDIIYNISIVTSE